MYRHAPLAAVLILLTVAPVPAREICESHLGHLRIRERCHRHETAVDLRELLADPVQLRDWVAAPAESAAVDGIEGTQSISVAPDSTMINLDPCRLIDTRPGFASAFVGDDIGAFAQEEERSYGLTGLCGIPVDATALSINLAIVPGTSNGFATIGPGGSIPAFPPGPSFASINYQGNGPAISNSLVVPLDDMGEVEVYSARAADVIIDTNGYFLPKDAGAHALIVPATGTPIENGDALDAALAEIATLPASIPVTLQLGAGAFDLGTTGIDVSRPMRLEGAGQSLTMLTCDCETNGVIRVLASGAGTEIHDLHVDNTATTGSTPDGIVAGFFSGLLVRNVLVTTTFGRGLLSTSGSDIVVENVTFETNLQAVSVSGSGDVTVRDSRLTSTASDPLLLSGAIAVIENSTLETDGASAIGAIALGIGADCRVRHSRLVTTGGSYVRGSAGTFDMTNSFIDAGAIAFPGTATCAATTSSGAFTATGCP